jgi:hypothetical protein
MLDDRPLFVWCALPLLVLYVLSIVINDAMTLFSLVTANTLITHTYVWNLVTSSFFEANPFKLGTDLVILWLISKDVGKPNIEQFGLYFVFGILACSIGTSIICFLRFVGTGHEFPLITSTYGFSGVLLSLFMYARHALRGQPLHPHLFPQMTYHYLPTLYIGIQIILRIIGLRIVAMDLSFSCIGLLFSWSYLKFYYRHVDNEPPGDRTDDFNFVGMFPEPLHIVLVPFTTAFYNLMAVMNIYPPLENTDRKGSYHHLRSTTGPTTTTTTTLSNNKDNTHLSILSSSTTIEDGIEGDPPLKGKKIKSSENPKKQDPASERRRAKAKAVSYRLP